MTDKVQKIREEVERLKEETSIGLSEHENGIEQGRMEIINALSLFLDSMQEEPVSEDLDIAAIEYSSQNKFFLKPTDVLALDSLSCCAKDSFIIGANWQKEQLMVKAVETTFNVSLPSGLYDKLWIKCCKDGDRLLVIKKDEL